MVCSMSSQRSQRTPTQPACLLVYMVIAIMFATITLAEDMTVRVVGPDGRALHNVYMVVMYHEKSGFEYVAKQFEPAMTGEFVLAVPQEQEQVTLHVSCEGYTRYFSEPLSTRSGKIDQTVHLQPSRMIKGSIPSAAGGQIILLSKYDDAHVTNGRIDCTWTNDQFQVGADGAFECTYPGDRFWVFAACDKGYALAGPFDDAFAGPVDLQRWKCIQGKVEPRASSAGQKMSADGDLPLKNPTIHCRAETTVGSDGSYRLDRVFPGKLSISKTGAASSEMRMVQIPQDREQAVLDFGSGASVVTRIQMRPETTKYTFRGFNVSLMPSMQPIIGPRPPESFQWTPAQVRQWELRKEVTQHPLYAATKAQIAAARNLSATPDSKGSLEFHDVADGCYELDVLAWSTSHESIPPLAVGCAYFTVQQGVAKGPDSVLCELQAVAKVGDPLGQIAGHYLDGRSFDSKALAGKTLVVIPLRAPWDVKQFQAIDAFAREVACDDIAFVALTYGEHRAEVAKVMLNGFAPSIPIIIGTSDSDALIHANCNVRKLGLLVTVVSPDQKFQGIGLTIEESRKILAK